MPAYPAIVRPMRASEPPAIPGPSQARWLQFATVALAALGVTYVGGGLYHACFGELPQDLARRWLEGSYMVRGINALDVFDGVSAPEPDLGPMHPGGYPPWATAFGILLVPPFAQEWVRIYFSALNLAALALVVHYAYRAGARYGTDHARLFAASVLAVASNAVVLRHGQYGIVVNALLVLLLRALERQHFGRAGLFLGFAALKPQSSAPFAFLLLRRHGIRAVAAAALLIGATTLVASLHVGRSPLHILRQVFGQAAHWEGGDSGILRLLLEAGVPRAAAIPALAGTSLIVGGALLHRYRHASLALQAALLCVVARLWAYHRRYDDMLLVFLLIPLAGVTLTRPNRLGWILFFCVGLTLWLPFREVDHGVPLIGAKVTLWLLGLAWLLRAAERDADKVPDSARLRLAESTRTL